jgi:hypothetical protein
MSMPACSLEFAAEQVSADSLLPGMSLSRSFFLRSLSSDKKMNCKHALARQFSKWIRTCDEWNRDWIELNKGPFLGRDAKFRVWMLWVSATAGLLPGVVT